MTQFRKKPVVIDATQWFKNGDHPLDNSVPVRRLSKAQQEAPMRVYDITEHEGDLVPDPHTGAPSFLSEGKVVRYFRRPERNDDELCEHCGRIMHAHGWIDTLEGGHIVCPGDWVITGVKGERYPCKPDIFEATYEPV